MSDINSKTIHLIANVHLDPIWLWCLPEGLGEAVATSRIAIEPLNRYETNFLNLGSDALNLIEQVDSAAVGLHLDPYHMNIEEPGFAGPIEEAGEKLYHFWGAGHVHMGWIPKAL